jgi:phosphoglycolate phosphatase
LVLIDLDNTLYDWVAFFVPSMLAMLDELCVELSAEPDQLREELRSVFKQHGSVEYSFCLQALPAVARLPLRRQRVAIERGHQAFAAARDKHLVSYPGVRETLQELSATGMTLVATTNAPMYQATRRLQRLGVASWFDALAARRSFAAPANLCTARTIAPRQRVLATPPEQAWEFEVDHLKPSARMYQAALDATGTAPASALAVGDHFANDIAPALRLGARGAWARYGRTVDDGLWQGLLTVTPWGSAKIAAQNADLVSTVPTLNTFSDVLQFV